MNIISIEAESRYILDEGDVSSAERTWRALTLPFEERHKSWHPSHSDFEPVSTDRNGRADEFEVRGAQGGRSPWKIEEWNEDKKKLRLWVGPSKNPPSGSSETFRGLTMEFQVVCGIDSSFVEVTYKERWSKKPWLTKKKCFQNGPVREISWIFDEFPVKGKIDYIRELDAAK